MTTDYPKDYKLPPGMVAHLQPQPVEGGGRQQMDH